MRIRPVALAALVFCGLGALWRHSQSRHYADTEFVSSTNPDGTMEWTILMPADGWREIQRMARDDRHRQSEALQVVIASAFDAAHLQGEGCHIVAISPLAGRTKIEGSCRPVAGAGRGTIL